ncbi:MAG: hypothetical protein FWB88_08160 [Defluviitaleaceae bacterium]|nr:hypothetical protein [Defluviitaleaceae bacterium]MCL2240658.1 hypothetical protein [Defluviitaleaceae bacterium]
MQCRTHPAAQAVNTCNTCGEWLCEACTTHIDGRLFCRACLAQVKGYDAPCAPEAKPPFFRRVRWGLVFIFSFLPGANYMYMGLIKRGLAAMCGFFLLIYLLTLVSGSILGGPLTLLLSLSLPVVVLTCAFDSFNIRRRMLAGEVVNDNIDDVIGFFARNKKILIMVVLLCVGLGVAGSLVSALVRPLRHLIPLLIIGLGIYAVTKRKG